MPIPLSRNRSSRTWSSRAPWWWFGVPVFAYVLLTPRLLSDIVSVPKEMSGVLPAVRCRDAVDLLNQNVTSRGMCLRPCLAQALRVE
jgi:hypothetical protein